jgi:hypothetical protein
MEISLNLHCPACGAAIVPRPGCCGYCLARAVQLQTVRFGTELFCRKCGGLHVVLRTDASRGPSWAKGHAPHRLGADDWQIEVYGEPDDRPT